ncbi:hypothetical protein ALQ65_00124 [Pseudomonas syringae pv. coriandricola]|uniref:Uncharacterized protein n=1 Tax=Pseudomonas syringae pv. coriandricola TaxID=264453 RepID=A0A0P9L4H8_9PSED|nr:Uncharacterized protein ALO76_03694 [Pseudomonas syringae pv. coriandricola]RMN09243.1 hypothetical protein ALQ65_00124 [Pseudomonas syringae pv. coriandricola]
MLTWTSGFQPLFAVLFAQAQDAQAGAEAVLRMDPAFEDMSDDTSGVWPGLLSPVDQSLRRPFGVFAMALGHVLGLGVSFELILKYGYCPRISG